MGNFDFQKYCKITWSFHRNWPLFSCMKCIKIIIFEQYLEIWHSSNEKFLTKLGNFWAHLPPKLLQTWSKWFENFREVTPYLEFGKLANQHHILRVIKCGFFSQKDWCEWSTAQIFFVQWSLFPWYHQMGQEI